MEEMAAAGTLDAGRAVVELQRLGGAGHPAIARLKRVSPA